MEVQTFFTTSENHSRVKVLSFQAGWCIYNLFFPAMLSQGGLARCLLMCISRRLDDQRVIGAVGEGTESMGGAGRTLITNLRWRHDIAPARYISKTPSPFQRHNCVILIYGQLCMSARRRECMEKRRKNSVWSMTRVLGLMGGDLDKTGIILLSDPKILIWILSCRLHNRIKGG